MTKSLVILENDKRLPSHPTPPANQLSVRPSHLHQLPVKPNQQPAKPNLPNVQPQKKPKPANDLSPVIYHKGEHIIVVSPVRLPEYDKSFESLAVHMDDIKPFINGEKIPHHYRIVKGQILTKWQAFVVKIESPKWHELTFVNNLSPDVDIAISINPKDDAFTIQCNLHKVFQPQNIEMLKNKSKHKVSFRIMEIGTDKLLQQIDLELKDLLERKKITLTFEHKNFRLWTNWRASTIEAVQSIQDPFVTEVYTSFYELLPIRNPDCLIEVDYKSLIFEYNKTSLAKVPPEVKLIISEKDNPYYFDDFLTIKLDELKTQSQFIMNIDYDLREKTVWIVNDSNVIKFLFGLYNPENPL